MADDENPPAELQAAMSEMGRRARAASRSLAEADGARRSAALGAAAELIRERTEAILSANGADVAAAKAAGAKGAFLDRLQLDAGRIESMAGGLKAVAALKDPIGDLIERRERPNGLILEKIRVPLGVVGIIFESRPNVTADAAAIAVKSGNAVILRAGSEAERSARAIAAAMRDGLHLAGLPADAVQLVPVTDRAAVGLMLGGLDGAIDVIVPRGGKGLVARVQREARVPVIAHLDGLCHVYIDKAADPDMAERILINAKMRRTSVCGAAETLLIDAAGAAQLAPRLIAALLAAGCEVRGDEAIQRIDRRVLPANEEDWSTEYLDAIISARIVDGVAGAIRHIETYGSHHTDTIVTADEAAAETFLARVDSAIVLHNASTQFADGGEFGMGAEIGIGTGKIHARGPVGAAELTSYKWVVRGTGQVRP